MNYALAKQLVEAGFPHKESDWDGVGCVPNIGAHSPTKP